LPLKTILRGRRRSIPGIHQSARAIWRQTRTTVNHRSSFRRVIRHWALAAACGISLTIAAVGCEKKAGDPATPAATPPPVAGAKTVGVLDPGKMMTAMGWATQRQSAAAAYKSEIERQVKVFTDRITAVVTEERAKLNKSPGWTTDMSDKLAKGELDKLNLTKEQREEYIKVITTMNSLQQQLNQLLYNIGQKWEQDVNVMITETARPAVRRAAQAQGIQVVMLSNQVLHFESTVDLTDKVVDEMQKAPPQPHFPTAPNLDLPNFTLADITNAATQPSIPTAPTTKPAAK
jgi:Skp family chaperone for outer membrane proteins